MVEPVERTCNMKKQFLVERSQRNTMLITMWQARVAHFPNYVWPLFENEAWYAAPCLCCGLHESIQFRDSKWQENAVSCEKT